MVLVVRASADDNVITNCQMGIVFQDYSGSAEDNTVKGGTVGLLGIWAQYMTAGTWAVSFVDNTVSGVSDSTFGYVADNAAIGAQTYVAGASLTVAIDDNTITGKSTGGADGVMIGDTGRKRRSRKHYTDYH